RESADAPRTVASQPRQDAFPDYFAYEARMRAPTEEIRERQRPYVELFRGHEPVLDIGCGRGELLQLLRDEHIAARGIDADADMVAFAHGAGLDARQEDLLDELAATDNGSPASSISPCRRPSSSASPDATSAGRSCTQRSGV